MENKDQPTGRLKPNLTCKKNLVTCTNKPKFPTVNKSFTVVNCP